MRRLNRKRGLNPNRIRSWSVVPFAQHRLAQLEFSIGSRIQAIRDVPPPDEAPPGFGAGKPRSSKKKSESGGKSIPGLAGRLAPFLEEQAELKRLQGSFWSSRTARHVLGEKLREAELQVRLFSSPS